MNFVKSDQPYANNGIKGPDIKLNNFLLELSSREQIETSEALEIASRPLLFPFRRLPMNVCTRVDVEK